MKYLQLGFHDLPIIDKKKNLDIFTLISPGGID
jgi:hypothetical protein